MLRCIFCKGDSSTSRSVEHILPQSIGNDDGILPKGVVCDKCNNYFAKELESKVLNSGIIRAIRNRMRIPSKKGRVPPPPENSVPNVTDYRTMSRFLGKIGMEELAKRLRKVAGWEAELIDKPELDPLREYVRFNRGKEDWVFSFRTLHPVDALFYDGKEYFELLNEWDLLYTDRNELFVIVSLFGVEFSLNLGGPGIDGYLDWVRQHDGASPLYFGKNL